MTDKEKTTDGLSYSRVLHVEQRIASDSPDRDRLLAIMRERAPDPSIFDEFSVYLFNGQISSNVWDSYDTRMAESTLKNYGREANTGVAFIRGHRAYSTDPIGHSLTGQFIGGQGNGVARVTSDWYVIRDEDSAVFVDRMRGGAIRDLSVGFYGGEWMCSICGKDMDQWMLRDGCHHYLGMMYQPRDESGMPKGEAVKCRATIENAHLSEFSGVFEGATPGCMISKARAMAAEGLLRGQERELVEVRYRIHLPAYAKPFPGVDPDPDGQRAAGNTNTEDTDMDTIRIADGTLLTAEEVGRHVKTGADVRALLDEFELSKGKEPGEGVRALLGEITRLRAIETDVASIRGQANDGKQYRTDLVNEALAEGVRAEGDKFDREANRSLLESLPLDAVKRMRDSWCAIGDKLFAGGRQTTDDARTDEPPASDNRSTVPAAAYRVG